jgi:uncharacterized membrane protein
VKKSLFGLEENVVGALCYAFGFVTGIAALILEKENKFVRFHALQSTIWSLFLGVIGWVLGHLVWVPLIGWLIGIAAGLVGLLSFVSWIFLMVKAWSGESFKLPVIGDAVWNQINK